MCQLDEESALGELTKEMPVLNHSGKQEQHFLVIRSNCSFADYSHQIAGRASSLLSIKADEHYHRFRIPCQYVTVDAMLSASGVPDD